MVSLSRRTLRNGAIGGIVGGALGFIPLVLLVAPVVGGGLAGYLEREGAKRGAVAGAVAGALMAALSTVITGVIVFVRFGDLPVPIDAPLAGLGIAALLSLVATAGQVVVAAIGGALGAILASDRAAVRDDDPGDAEGNRRWRAIGTSVVVGLVTFLVVGVVVSVVLEPWIWLSVLVGIPAGFVAGAAAAVLGYRYLTRGPDTTMNWRAIGAGVAAAVVVFALAAGGLSILGQQHVDRTVQSTYDYQVTVSADRTLTNATFYVPVPTEGGESDIGERLVENVQYSRDVPALEGYDPDPTPVNFTYDLVETDHGRMLAITADRVEVDRVYYREVENETMGWRERIPRSEYDPSTPEMGILDDGHFQFSVSIAANDSIETTDPFDEEPLLVPQYNRTTVECDFSPSENQRCFTYDSRVYASYDTEANTTVYVGVESSGRNEWFSGGWSGNEYREWAYTELHGPGSGWYRLGGTLDIRIGAYR